MNDTMRFGSYYGGRPAPSPLCFPEKDEKAQVVLYNHKGEPLYRIKPKFGYRSDNDA